MKIKNKNLSDFNLINSNNRINLLEAISFMEKTVNDIFHNKEKEMIWFLEHESVYTCGRSQVSNEKKINNTPVYNINRGGKVTWHGPGQRIIYFMLNLKKRKLDIRYFVKSLEQIVIDSLLELNIAAFRKKGLIGIWTKNFNEEDAKIASLGLRVSRGIVYHGLSINVNCNLSNFNYISPCGISNAKVTSIKELKNKIEISKFDNILKKHLYRFL